MKKKFYVAIAVSGILLATSSCSKDEEVINATPSNEVQLKTNVPGPTIVIVQFIRGKLKGFNDCDTRRRGICVLILPDILGVESFTPEDPYATLTVNPETKTAEMYVNFANLSDTLQAKWQEDISYGFVELSHDICTDTDDTVALAAFGQDGLQIKFPAGNYPIYDATEVSYRATLPYDFCK